VRPLTFDGVLGRLSGAKPGRRPGTATAFCPVPQHADRNASLSVKATDTGVILLKCFGGCTFEEIWSALGIGPTQLMGRRVSGWRVSSLRTPTEAGSPRGDPQYRRRRTESWAFVALPSARGGLQ